MGGQGIISLGNLIGISSMIDKKFVSIVPSYGAEMRGGISNCFVTVSDDRIGAPVFHFADIGIFMYQLSMDTFINKIRKKGIVIFNENMVKHIDNKKDIKFIGVPANRKDEEIGNAKAANMILAGIWCKLRNIVKYDSVVKGIQEMFSNKSSKIIELNKKAFEFGYKFLK